MPRIHIVVEGEHMAGIAAKYGFGSYRTVWDHPDNAALRAIRSPHILAPGDEITVPDFEAKSVDAATEKRHRFTWKKAGIELRVVFLGADGTPLAGAPCDLDLPGAPPKATMTGDGMLSVRIADTTSLGAVTIREMEIAARVGYLDPVDRISGWQGRLMNLGYYTGPVGQLDDPRSRLAIEEFQLDSGLPVTGIVDGATRSALLAAHGC